MKSASTKMYLSTEEEMKAAEVNGIYWTLLCCLTISYSLNIIYIYIYIIYISLPFYRTMFLLCLVMLMYLISQLYSLIQTGCASLTWHDFSVLELFWTYCLNFFFLKPCLWCKNTPGQRASLPTQIITVVTMFWTSHHLFSLNVIYLGGWIKYLDFMSKQFLN